jgi:hypothetical protein
LFLAGLADISELMAALKAYVSNGKLVLNEPTTLPEGCCSRWVEAHYRRRDVTGGRGLEMHLPLWATAVRHFPDGELHREGRALSRRR